MTDKNRRTPEELSALANASLEEVLSQEPCREMMALIMTRIAEENAIRQGKKSVCFTHEPRECYFELAKNARGWTWLFCYTASCNTAGYYLSYVRKATGKGQWGQPEQVVAHKRRSDARARAIDLYYGFLCTHGHLNERRFKQAIAIGRIVVDSTSRKVQQEQ